jgi:DNA mismatch repair protein MutS
MEEDSLFYCASKDVTPMMTQYLEIKSQYEGCLLLFRMGDFYEMFFDDAKVASSVLNIALTSRGKHLENDIPMCGIPAAALENYVGRLVKYGYKVAICDQMENPIEAKKRGHKAIVKRDVTRIITPGTIIEDSLLNSRRNNFLMSVVPDIHKKTSETKCISFATIDISTGDFFVNTVLAKEFSAIMEMYQPKEILVPSCLEQSNFMNFISSVDHTTITYLPDSKFNPITEGDRLKKYFNVKALDSFGIFINNELSACGSILEYLIITQKDALSTIPIPKKTIFSDYLIIDSSTSKSLEIISSTVGEYRYSLLGALDKTATSFGARSLAARISTPIIDKEKIVKRLNCVEFFIKNEKMSKLIHETLCKCPDFERAINRIKFNKFSPRDVGDIRESLRILDAIKLIIKDTSIPSEGDYSFDSLKNFSELKGLLETALVEILPVSNKDGKIVADGYSKKLDELKYIKNHSEELISNLQTKYIAETNISNLKIRNNGILGWYIEVSLSQKNKVTSNFIHRQTLVNSVRYVTDELIDLQTKLGEAFDDWSKMEQHLYAEIIDKIMARYDDISYAIKLLSCLDIYTNFARLAVERNYIRPEIFDEPVLEIEDGRHPILETHTNEFISNSCDLKEDSRVCLLTGPNMAGKSTYLRQNALIIVMAQIGCYVPATKAKIGIVDRLFSRIGASDDIARGRSTFMVEMIETATILNQATEKSFVILDEVGRGTSTYDGLAIAWAVIENLYKTNKCRVLFATHYRELTELQKYFKKIKCKTLKVQEWNGDVIFYHKIVDGIADKSYGIHVASIAGVPKHVVKRAKELLKKFENENSEKDPLFNGLSNRDTADIDSNPQEQINTQFYDEKSDLLKNKISKINLDTITPKNALDILYELKDMIS